MRSVVAIPAIALFGCADLAPPVAVCSDAGAIVYRGDVILLADDPRNCGCVGEVCPPAQGEHALPSCAAGVCGQRCEAEWGDCDGDVTNGCETSLRTRADHCGDCGTACRPARATPSCVAGRCMVGVCEPGTADCDREVANGCEVSTRSDARNCGGCGTVCEIAHAVASCEAGRCVVARCESGWADCDRVASNGCEQNVASDDQNCGACGAACGAANASSRCQDGRCASTCLSGYGNCDSDWANGCEVNLQTDGSNCGSCSRACVLDNASAYCNNGRCEVLQCSTPYRDCDQDPSNGCEVNTLTNASHCGACGSTCFITTGTAYCASGACAISSCIAGRGNCDRIASNGCEVDITASASNCGGCSSPGNSFACPFNRRCDRSICVCSLGLTECSGQCVSLQTSSSNCGRCGNVCPGQTQCINGSCQCGAGLTRCRNFCGSCPAGSRVVCNDTMVGCCANSTTYCYPAWVCWNGSVACNTVTQCSNLENGWGICGNANQRVQCNPFRCL